MPETYLEQIRRENLEVTQSRLKRRENEIEGLTVRVEALEKSVRELAMSVTALFAVVKSVVDRRAEDEAALLALVDPMPVGGDQ